MGNGNRRRTSSMNRIAAPVAIRQKLPDGYALLALLRGLRPVHAHVLLLIEPAA
jgi:hypothetical protein